MSRSLYKPYFLDKSLIGNLLKRQITNNKRADFIDIINRSGKIKKMENVIFVFNRSSKISKLFVDKFVGIYNGYMFQLLHVADNHIGFKFGDFSLTRRTPNRISKKITTKGKSPKFRPAKLKTKKQLLRYSFKLNVRQIKEKVIHQPNMMNKMKDRHFVFSKNKKKPKVWNKKTYNWKKRKGKLYHK